MSRQNLAGAPGVTTTITDLSEILANTLKGIVCVSGVTSRGEAGKEYLCGNWGDYKRQLGGYVEGDDFALYCKRALDSGAKLRVAPVFHFTDIDDLSTIAGTKATAKLVTTAEVLAGVLGSITAMGTAGDEVTVQVDTGGGFASIGTYTKQSGDTEAVTATKLVQNINDTAQTNGGWTAEIVAGADFKVLAPVNSGATANTYNAQVNVTGTLTATIANTFSGGVDAQSVDFETLSPTEGYNGSTIEVVDAASGDPTKCDLVISLLGSSVSQQVRGVSRTLTAGEVENINKKLYQLKLTSFTGTIVNTSATFSGGQRTLSDITNVDWKGSTETSTGWHAFDSVTDSMRAAILYDPSPERDADLEAYCRNRGDMVAHIPLPINLSIQEMNDYRDGTGAYSHSPLNSYFARYIVSDLILSDEADPEIKSTMYGAADVIALQARKDDRYGEWFSAAGYNRGVIRAKTNGVPTNLASKGNKTQFDVLYEKGVNAIVVNDKQPMYWGNRTTLLDKTSLLSKENVADLCIFIARVLSEIAKSFVFDPNDPQMWRKLYLKVRPFIVGTLVGNRAIQSNSSESGGEGELWFWFGDQQADSIKDVTFNDEAEINAGKYRARFLFVPIAATEYIAIDVAPTDSVTLTNIVQNPTN